MKVYKVACWEDNYSYILLKNSKAVIIDPCDADPIIQKLNELDFKSLDIINTHHHPDHVSGNNKLVEVYSEKLQNPPSVHCSERDQDRVPHANVFWPMDDHQVEVGDIAFHKFHTPGHTEGHFCLFQPDEKLLFCGDVLFSLGCGRLFEGTAEELFASHDKLLNFLPPETKVYCGHEYTLGNLQFTEWVMNIMDLGLRQGLERLLAQNSSTIPSTWAFEAQFNLFLACRRDELRKYLAKRMQLPSSASALEVFKILRKTRNQGIEPSDFVV